MKKRKVLQVLTGKMMYDGLSKVVIGLIDNCPRDRADIYVLLGKGAITKCYRDLDQREIIYFEGPDRELSVFRYIVYLYRILKREKFDVVHVHGNSATMALEQLVALICGVKIRISHCHNTVTNHPAIHLFLKPLLRILTTVPVACGNDAGYFLFGNEFHIIPNCISTKDFAYNERTRANWRKKLKVEDKIVVGNVGRFRYQKNHELLVSIFNEFLKNNPNSVLLLIGSGELENEIREQIKKFRITNNVIFYGNSDNVDKIMQAMDLFVLPSHYEGLSITAIEAQCSGLPCFLANTISLETKKSDFCHFVRIDAPLSKWAEKMEYYYYNSGERKNGEIAICNAGYDISNLKKYVVKLWKIERGELHEKDIGCYSSI